MPAERITNGDPLRTVFLGVTTPISDLTLPYLDSQIALAIVSTRGGTLTADTASGAQVRGSGSTYITLSGTPTQIAATLASVGYSSALAGVDQLSIALLTQGGAVVPVTQLTLTIMPLAGPAHGVVSFDSGTLTLQSQTLDGPDLRLIEPDGSHNATTVILINSTIGGSSQLTIRNENATAKILPRLAIAGHVELDGETGLYGSGTAVSLARGATLSNQGTMTIDAGSTHFTGDGLFLNDGTVRILGGSASGVPTEIATALAGSGTIMLTSAATLRLGASVGAGETVRLGDGANVLHLAQPGTFAGSIAGFSTGDALVLDGVAASDALYTPVGARGVLTILNGTHPVAKIDINAPEAGTEFHLSTDIAGNVAISLVAAAAGTVEVFRFFDSAHGTQLLTQDATERDTILTTRADLHYEGVGLHAVDPAHATSSAVDVYRFFDIGSGTHFMTSSASERDSVLASRPDLVFEPNSTMIEHATAQAGDSAVYRFFNNTNGAHFYTADAGERASILVTRPDMTLEGIAFYAPGA